MGASVHGVVGLGALFWANIHGAPAVQPQHHLQAQQAVPHVAAPKPYAAAAKTPATPKPRPSVAAVAAPVEVLPPVESTQAPVETAPVAEATLAPLPRARPALTFDTDAIAVTYDERRDFHSGAMQLPARVAEASAPLPRIRPTALKPSDPFAAYGGSRPAAPEMLTAFLPPPAAQHISPDDDAACRARLDAMGVKYSPESGVQFVSDSCTVVGPLKVSAVGPGMTIAPAATMNCRTTEAVAKWMRDVVAPAAEKHLKTRPTGIAQASAFVCRPVNNVAGAKLSEHATGNAVDIASIGLQGQAPFPIHAWSDDQPDERDFQAEIRQGACGLFTTVLGPGTNAEHATHFHLDLAQRRGGSHICE